MIKGVCFQNELKRSSSSEASLNDTELLMYNIAGCFGVYTDVVTASIKSVKRVLLAPKCKRKGPRGGVSEPFPSKLYDMLVGLETEGLTHIASWMDHGRCFRITQQDIFISDVMPRYFKQSKLTSFQRQMNLYGFQRVSSGVDTGCFYHPLFLRGRPDLCLIMLRTRTKGNCGIITKDCGRAIPCESLYDLPRCPPVAPRKTTTTSNLDDSEDLCRTVSTPTSLQSELVSPALIPSLEFPRIPYTTPAVPCLLDNTYCQPLPQDKIQSPEQHTLRCFQSSKLIKDQEVVSSSASFESFSIDSLLEHTADDLFKATTEDNVVSPNLAHQPWVSKFFDDGTSNSNSEDRLWGFTLHDDEVNTHQHNRSLDRPYRPWQS